MKITSRKEAWEAADRIFPTDYEEDSESSKTAGYPIFRSTEKGNTSWISDLGNTLELNIQEKEGIRTVRISISKPEPPVVQIHEEDIWDRSSVRDVCIGNDLYTCGTIKEYEKMLSIVDENEPDTWTIYRVAKDILEHSEGQTITNIMFLLRNRAVQRFYEVTEE